MAWPPKNGKPFVPSNGSEGMVFHADWCDRCVWRGEDDESGCAILTASFCGEVPQWTWQGGRPTCSEFKEHEFDGLADVPLEDPRQLVITMEVSDE